MGLPTGSFETFACHSGGYLLVFFTGEFQYIIISGTNGIFKEIYEKLQAEMKGIFSNKITAFLALSVAALSLKKLCSEE